MIFDEAHKLSAWRDADLTMQSTRRYEMAEQIAEQGRHLLLMTATPHMGKDDPYYYLWRLLEPELLSTPEAFARVTPDRKTAPPAPAHEGGDGALRRIDHLPAP